MSPPACKAAIGRARTERRGRAEVTSESRTSKHTPCTLHYYMRTSAKNKKTDVASLLLLPNKHCGFLLRMCPHSLANSNNGCLNRVTPYGLSLSLLAIEPSKHVFRRSLALYFCRHRPLRQINQHQSRATWVVRDQRVHIGMWNVGNLRLCQVLRCHGSGA